MKKSDLEKILNYKQLSAVTAKPGNTLILSGAGSGKTTVLVNRIAWLINANNVLPNKIMAVTFTNKSACELKKRIKEVCGNSSKGILVGTFHSISYRILKKHYAELGLTSDFRILDDREQMLLIKKIHKFLKLEESAWPAKKTQWFINHCKSLGERPQISSTINQRTSHQLMYRIYLDYENYCRRNNLVDFGELTLSNLELFKNHPRIKKIYRESFDHILVDEFQDTNSVQYDFLKLISSEKNFVTAVGDDDQSIYGWRGSSVKNTRNFIKEYPKVRVIRLEQNYRSTKRILHSANEVIKFNTERLEKNLWTEVSDGENLKLYCASNEQDESYNVARNILNQIQIGYSYKDIVILYRTSAQSRYLEKDLIKNKIPYKVYGNMKFFERAEIKDALAYAHLINNKNDDTSFLRIINKPPRGIGKQTVDSLKSIAEKHKISLWQAGKNLIKLSKNRALTSFMELIHLISKEIANMDIQEQMHHILSRSGLLKFYNGRQNTLDSSQIDNLKELMNAIKQFQSDYTNDSYLSSFLSSLPLEEGKDHESLKDNSVNLMTIHASKGLEFPIVFIIGMEEGLFPHRESMKKSYQLEEERRLCYVAITRAMHKLYLSYSESRYVSGRNHDQLPSRFIKEIPDQYLDISSYKDRL